MYLWNPWSIFDEQRTMVVSSGWPQFDIEDSEDETILTVDVPGMRDEDIEITVQGSLLIVRGERKKRGAFEWWYQLGDVYDLDHVRERTEIEPVIHPGSVMNRHVYVAVADAAKRARIVDELRREGCTVIEQPTGFHVLGEIADVIEGKARDAPAKIVVDAYARGCTGSSLAEGLRALGVDIPVEVVDQQLAAA